MILLVLTLGILTFYFSRPSIKTVEKENIVVIGASQGIGKELSLKLAKRTCNLILVSRRLDQLLELKSQLETLDNKPKIHIFQADWTSEKQLELLLEYVKTQFKSLNSLFLCAGVLSVSTFEELLEIPESAEIIQSIFNVNSIGPILTTKMFLPLLIESKGLLVVLSSTAGVVAAPTRTLYCATKHALTGFFRALRIEVKNKGVDICIVMPGRVDTSIRKSALDSSYSQQRKESKGIAPDVCANLILEAADRRQNEVFIPRHYRFAAILANIIPTVIERLAALKYGFK